MVLAELGMVRVLGQTYSQNLADAHIEFTECMKEKRRTCTTGALDWRGEIGSGHSLGRLRRVPLAPLTSCPCR